VTYVVALTGGIGSGKSAVSERLASRGATVVDTDEISRALTAAGGGAVEALRAAFGEGYVTGEGALDRDAMRTLAFEDPQARARLEAVLHPAIREASDREIAAARGPYVLLVVPLLFETGGHSRRAARVLVVDCDESLQVARTMQRSSLPEAQVRRIMAAQWPRWRRLQSADDVIWNGGEAAALGPQCDRLHAFYLGNAARIAPQSRPTQRGAR
jgi:dephospho-CoA kinase